MAKYIKGSFGNKKALKHPALLSRLIHRRSPDTSCDFDTWLWREKKKQKTVLKLETGADHFDMLKCARMYAESVGVHHRVGI